MIYKAITVYMDIGQIEVAEASLSIYHNGVKYMIRYDLQVFGTDAIHYDLQVFRPDIRYVMISKCSALIRYVMISKCSARTMYEMINVFGTNFNSVVIEILMAPVLDKLATLLWHYYIGTVKNHHWR